MSHLAILPLPDYGHVKPTAEITAELVRRGHRVTQVVDERYAGLATEAGASVITYRSRRRRLGGHEISPTELGEVFSDLVAETVESVLPVAESEFADDVPDLVLFDFGLFAVARTLARRWSRPKVQLFPFLASNEEFQFWGDAVEMDEATFAVAYVAMLEVLAQDGMTEADAPAFAAQFDERNLVFVPREFQPMGGTFDERFAFVGPCLEAEDAAGDAAGDVWQPPHASERGVLLASLGTESNEQPEFFRMFGEAFKDQEWHAVLTLGHEVDVTTLGLDEHLEAHNWLPHTQVLPHAAAFVCHGGMGSMMEALYHRTPVVVVPQTPELRFNAQRVTELGLGTMIAEDDLTAHTLRAAVDEVANDARMRENVARMSAHIQQAGGTARAADVLEGWLAEGHVDGPR